MLSGEAIKLLEENLGANPHDLEWGNDFLETKPQVQRTKEKNW